MDLPSRVGRSGIFCFVLFFGFFFSYFLKISGSKNDIKNTKFSKTNLTLFAEKFWENILTYFQEFSAKSFRFWSKNGWLYKILENEKKKSAKMENLGRSCP